MRLIDIEVWLQHETEKAVLVDHGGKEKVWLPKSRIEMELCDDQKYTRKHGRYTITLPERLAIEKEMV